MCGLIAQVLEVLELKVTVQTKAQGKLSKTCQELISSLSKSNSRVIFLKTWSAQL